MKYDTITFGSAALDIFAKSEDFLIKPVREFTVKKGLCFPFGSKIAIEELDFHTGGGGTNTAAAFSLLGLKTAFCGKIGEDFAGEAILKDLKRFGVATPFVLKSNQKPTNLSIIFSFSKERTCFIWRGASELLDGKEIPFKKFDARWFYLAPFSGKLSKSFGAVVDFAKAHKIKVFANPGNSQINLGQKELKKILKNIDILLLNQEEASLLTKIPYQKQEKEIFKRINRIFPGIAIITKGQKGAAACDGKFIWQAKSPKVPVVEKTGAGDAFGSGFLAGFIKTQDIPFALQLGIANSASCVQKIGAKEGLLKKGDSWKRAKITKKRI